MNRTLLALWTMLLLSIVAISALAILWTRQLDRSARQHLRDVLVDRLTPYNRDIARTLEQYQLEFEREIPSVDLATLTGVTELKRNPLVQTLLIVDSEKRLLYPRLDLLALSDRSLLSDALAVVNDQAFASSETPQAMNQTRQTTLKLQSAQRAVSSAEGVAQVVGIQRGWTAWYHQRGLVLGYLWQHDTGHKAMIIVPRARWMADLIAALPDQNQVSTSDSVSARSSLTQLIDIEGSLVYQWGLQPAGMKSEADAEIPVASPLEGWRLKIFADEQSLQRLSTNNNRLATILGVGSISTALLLLGMFATQNLRRELRLASQRVSFVNQVSHELRTPLTNIRMYADLLADQLLVASDDVDCDKPATSRLLSRVEIIRNESERLSRLIGNVLHLAREGKDQPALHFAKTNIDELVDKVLAAFSPQLKAKQMIVDHQRGAPFEVLVDRDALEQILVNLLGNAEKYAASGEHVKVATSERNGCIEIRVEDRGPGIDIKMRDKVFEPFVRGGDSLVDPAGTGIGLSIARQLARRLGGDCVLEPSSIGACFCVRIPISQPIA